MTCFAAGDPAAFDELYRRYERPIFGFCLRLCGDPDTAADSFQDAFLRVIELRSRYSETGRFRAWLFTIARSVCIDRLRRRRPSVAWHEAPPVASGGVSAERMVEASNELTRVLGILSPDQREVILLHKAHGFSHAEIAEMTDSTEAAVKQKMYRALLGIRRGEARPVGEPDSHGDVPSGGSSRGERAWE